MPVASVTHARPGPARRRRRPACFADAGIPGDRVGVLRGQAEPDRVAEVPVLGRQPGEEVMGAAGAVGPDQQVPPTFHLCGELGEGVFHDGDVVRGSVAPGVPGAEQDREGLPEPFGPWSANAHNGWNPNPRL